MSRIVIDARELRTSTGRYIERLLHYLQKIDGDEEYIVLLYPKDMASWEPSNPRFSKMACGYKEFTFAEQLGMAKLLYKLKPDLVHFTMTQQPLLYFKKSITTVHDLTTARFVNPAKNKVVFKLKQQVYKVVILYAARKSRRIITPSKYVAQDLVKYSRIEPRKITVTYESADKIEDPPVSLPSFPNLQNLKYIMYLGRPLPHKNLDRLVAAFKIAQVKDPTLHLILAGRLDYGYRVMQKQAGPNVIFTDFISDGELRWLYEHAAAYVFPSLSEGFGLPGLEAMCYQLPLASSNATCLPEVYGDAALYFDPTNLNDMANKIDQIVNDETVRQKIVTAQTPQLAKYSWQRMAEKTLVIYREALK